MRNGWSGRLIQQEMDLVNHEDKVGDNFRSESGEVGSSKGTGRCGAV